MNTRPDQPDPSLYIDRLLDRDAFHREAAAWTLGEIGSRRAGRPLAGLLLRELKSVERSGFLDHSDVVRAGVEAIRRIGAVEALYALVRALCVLSRAKGVDEETIIEIVETIGDVGGPNALREATERVVREAGGGRIEPARRIVGGVLFSRLSLCGDGALNTLRRLASCGPPGLKPMARRAYASVS